jgi:small GTP-binding protein
LDILDTAGQEEYSAMRDQYMRTGQAFILVYSITDPSSFQDCQQIHEQLLRSVDSDEVPLVLVGNKCDLEEERGVSTQEGKQMAEKFGNCKFFEASAKDRLNVEECFHALVKLLMNEGGEEDGEGENAGPTKETKKGDSGDKPKKKCLIL